MSPPTPSKHRKKWLPRCVKALQFVDADKLYPSTNCGMTPLSRHVAYGKLQALSAGAEIVRKELQG